MKTENVIRVLYIDNELHVDLLGDNYHGETLIASNTPAIVAESLLRQVLDDRMIQVNF